MSTAPNMPQHIEHLDTGALVPYARNSRTHSAEQVAQIAASIREFGFTNPVLIDGQGTIIAGHGRVMGAQALGLEQVPCIRLSHLSEAQRRAYVIADNQLALNAGWDDAVLADEINALNADGFDLDLLGFGDDLLAELLTPPPGAGQADADQSPEPPAAPVSRRGDVWQLGRHRIMCGDSTLADDLARLMDGRKAALLHADPPYGMGKEADGVENDNLYGAKLDAFQMSWWRAARVHLVDNASAYIWGNAPELWRLWWRGGLAESERMTMRNELVWRKWGGRMGEGSNTIRSYPPAGERCLFFMVGEQGFNTNADNYWEGWEPVRSYLHEQMQKAGWTVKDLNRITGTQMGGHWVTRSQWAMISRKHYEALQVAARDHDAFKRDHDQLKRDHDQLKREFYGTRAHFDNTHDNMTDVWDFDVVYGEDRHGHATPKPVAMMERVMRSSLPAGGLCLEPFSGSGSTLMGAERTGRICYTMELTPQYVDVAVSRWQTYTGQRATHADTGQPFPIAPEAVAA